MPLIDQFALTEHYAMHCFQPASGRACLAPHSGMGAMGAWYEYIPLWPSERESNPCAPSPLWCDYLGQAGYAIAECAPIDPIKCQAADFGPAMTPEMRQKALQSGTASVEAYCKANPEMCQTYSNYASVAGRDPEPGTPDAQPNYMAWLIGGTAAVAAVMLLTRR